MPTGKVWMEQNFKRRLGNLAGINAVIVPSFDDKIDSVFHDDSGDLTSGLIENETKMILKRKSQHRQSMHESLTLERKE